MPVPGFGESEEKSSAKRTSVRKKLVNSTLHRNVSTTEIIELCPLSIFLWYSCGGQWPFVWVWRRSCHSWCFPAVSKDLQARANPEPALIHHNGLHRTTYTTTEALPHHDTESHVCACLCVTHRRTCTPKQLCLAKRNLVEESVK